MPNIEDYTRVTEALGFFSGMKLINPEILRNAADRGTKVHEICTAIMENLGVLDFEPRFDGYIKSFNQWNNGKTFLERPPRFFCDKYMITGEVDGIYLDNGKLVLFDIKTSVNENITWALQGSAYIYLCRQAGYDIDRMEFIKLSKEGKEPKVYTYKERFELFLKCLELHNIFFKKMNQEYLLEHL